MSSNLFKAIDKRQIENILKRALNYEGWSIQGFGMLRLYLTKEIRLHVWDARFMVPNVSLVHDHPWNFFSRVIAGQIENARYYVREPDAGSPNYFFSTIQCGPGGGMRSEPKLIGLARHPSHTYIEGQSYSQEASEIHDTDYRDGTVTLVERTFKQDTEHARVFWKESEQWISAEPRKADEQEVEQICHRALSNWF